MNNIYLSILIPAYNEEKIIKGSLEKIINFLSGKKYDWEIVVVNDGSKDKMSDEVKKISKENVILVSYKDNRGKGGALKEGVNHCQGKYIIFTDADLSVPIETIDKFLQEMERDTDMVVGSRRVRGSKILVHQPFIRESLGRVFTLITKVFLNINLSDFTCGFKGFTNKVGKKIFGKSLIKRWAYDAEIVFLANKFKFKITEIPVSWVDRPNSRVRVGKAVVTSLADLFRIRFYNLVGKYD